MKWRSKTLPIIALGAVVATLSACAPREQSLRRNAYASREDCARDYSDAQCEARGASGGGYYGPYYGGGGSAARPDPGPGRTARNGQSPFEVTIGDDRTTQRGGFGDTARSDGGRTGSGG
jgi:hypothetical protein